MRSRSISRFQIAFLSAWALSLVVNVLTFPIAWESIQASGADRHIGVGPIAVVSIIGLLIPLFLLYMVVGRRSVVAKWALVAILVANIVYTAFALFQMKLPPGIAGGIQLLATLCRVAAIRYILMPDASEWFSRKLG